MAVDYDVLIAGGGMVGASLALALAGSSLRVALVEAVAADNAQQPSYDDRGLALSLSSKRIFEALDVWPAIENNANPIRHVHISDQGHFGKVRLRAADLGLPALGHVVVARELGTLLMQRLASLGNVDIICPARVEALEQNEQLVRLSLSPNPGASELSCRLLVIADGTHSSLREQLGFGSRYTDYGQTAIVSNLTPTQPHQDTAYERFTRNGPLAFLPLKENRCVVVHTVASDSAEHYLQMPADEYAGEIERQFGRRLGRLQKAGVRRHYPIVQVQAEQQLVGRALLLGNAAHTIHPNGAQGFNLCLRDVAGLAEQLRQAPQQGLEVGSRALLDAYLLMRLEDQRQVSRLSHSMTEWFYNARVTRAVLRNTAMTMIDLVPALKNQLMRRGMGISGRQPAVVRGLPV